jgi:GMP reductase
MINNYSDISLVPQKCIVNSRRECDTSFILGNKTFDFPAFPSNMTSVVDEETCEFMAKNNWFYVMHRFDINQINFCEKMISKNLFTSISVGVNDDSYSDLLKLKHANINPDYITIDIAHGWCDKMKNMISFIKENFTSFVIAGNVTTRESCIELEEWGANALKLSIGTGAACTTKNKTGFHIPIVKSLLDCSYEVDGIREPGDIAKALACGATAVMAGSFFSGFDQSAGDIIVIDGRHYKEYFGNASQYNKTDHKNIEGKKVLVEYKGDMKKFLNELIEDLQSSISYAGGKDLTAFKFVEIIDL